MLACSVHVCGAASLRMKNLATVHQRYKLWLWLAGRQAGKQAGRDLHVKHH